MSALGGGIEVSHRVLEVDDDHGVGDACERYLVGMVSRPLAVPRQEESTPLAVPAHNLLRSYSRKSAWRLRRGRPNRT